MDGVTDHLAEVQSFYTYGLTVFLVVGEINIFFFSYKFRRLNDLLIALSALLVLLPGSQAMLRLEGEAG